MAHTSPKTLTGPVPLTHQPTPHTGHHASTHNNPPAPQLTRTGTWHHAQLPYTVQHQPTTPHASHMPSHTPTHMPTPLTWPAARGTFRHPCHSPFHTRGAARSQERELQPFPDLLRVLFSRGALPCPPKLPHHLPFIWFQKVPSGQGLECEVEDRQWRGTTKVVLSTGVGAFASGS